MSETQSESGHTAPPCIICGTSDYAPGYGGRRAPNGSFPKCTGCGAVERHRIVRTMYQALKPITCTYRALQFAPDNTLVRENFRSLDFSVFGGENSLNMMDTGLPAGSYDLIASNHVLEHVKDDLWAIREMIRVVGSSGAVHVNVPSPINVAETHDWGFADPKKTFHYRAYGADAGFLLKGAMSGLHAIAAVGRDDVTETFDVVYWFSVDQQVLREFTRLLQRTQFPVIKIA